MTEEEKQAIDELKQTVADLSNAIKTDADNRQKQEAILQDVIQKQEKFEAARKRKGIFSDDDDNADVKVEKSTLDTLIHTKSIDDKVRELQHANDDILIVSQVLGMPPQNTKIYKDYVNANPFLKKAMYSTGTGVGDEWVPTGFSPQLYDLIRLELKVAALHPSIDMPTNPYQCPLVSSDLSAYLVSERTGDDDTLTAGYRIPASNVGTSNFTLSAKKIAARSVFSEELVEDSIIPILPLVRKNIVLSIAGAIENAIVNGDDSTAHQDSDTTNSTDVRKAWDGYRIGVQSGAKVSLDGTNWNADRIMAVRETMGKYGINPSDLVIVTGISGYLKMASIKDAQNNQVVTTIDKYGAGATIARGELAQLWGCPIIVSEKVRQDLNAAGIYDNTTKTKTILLFVYKNGFLVGNRRSLVIKTAEEITTDQTMLVATMRMAFSNIYPVASNYLVALGYNILV